LENVHNVQLLLKKMVVVLIWSAIFANIDFVGLVDCQKEVFFIKCKLILVKLE
jgi:hypothetical protein